MLLLTKRFPKDAYHYNSFNVAHCKRDINFYFVEYAILSMPSHVIIPRIEVLCKKYGLDEFDAARMKWYSIANLY